MASNNQHYLNVRVEGYMELVQPAISGPNEYDHITSPQGGIEPGQAAIRESNEYDSIAPNQDYMELVHNARGYSNEYDYIVPPQGGMELVQPVIGDSNEYDYINDPPQGGYSACPYSTYMNIDDHNRTENNEDKKQISSPANVQPNQASSRPLITISCRACVILSVIATVIVTVTITGVIISLIPKPGESISNYFYIVIKSKFSKLK